MNELHKALRINWVHSVICLPLDAGPPEVDPRALAVQVLEPRSSSAAASSRQWGGLVGGPRYQRVGDCSGTLGRKPREDISDRGSSTWTASARGSTPGGPASRGKQITEWTQL